jgi:hypothetical protein
MSDPERHKEFEFSRRTPSNRAEIARNILACAAAGERDLTKLELAALTNLKGNAAA